LAGLPSAFRLGDFFWVFILAGLRYANPTYFWRCSSQAKSKGDRWNDCPGFLKGKMKWKNSSHAFSLS
jgi:hypothetical protein